MRRQHKSFWIVTLAFLLGAAYLAARTAGTLVAAPPPPQPAVEQPQPRAPPPAAPPSPERLARLLGVSLVTEPPIEVPAPLEVQLVATILAARRSRSVAAIVDRVTRALSLYGPGDVLGDAQIESIDRGRVALLRGGRREIVTASSGPPAPDPAGGKLVTKGEYAFTRTERDRILSDLASVAHDARIAPAKSRGGAPCFKIIAIRPGSVFARMGLEKGDLVLSVDGDEINDPGKALAVYQRLRESGRFEVEIERRGVRLQHTYRISP